jgi:acetylornithine deacetylase/succinyl-diaminopimelate desuccinylase-like protein
VYIPVFAISQQLFNTWQGYQDFIIQIQSKTEFEPVPSFNIIAETKRGRDDRVVVAGAHIDSVPEGPGK